MAEQTRIAEKANQQLDGLGSISETEIAPLDEDVVEPAAFAVDTDGDAAVLQHAGEDLRGELGSLIGIEDLRDTEARRCLVEGLDKNVRIERARIPARRAPCGYPSPRSPPGT